MAARFNLVDFGAGTWRAGFLLFARDITYRPGNAGDFTIPAFLRGLRSEDTFAAAMQQDSVLEMDAAVFASTIGQATPRRYDRAVVGGQSFSVEEWRGAPNDAQPVFFKLLVRGGQQ
jgi:hypothetical protein